MTGAASMELLLYTHEDGRTAVVSSHALADFAVADPGWHRVPLDIVKLGPSAADPLSLETLTLHDIAPVAAGLVAEAVRLGVVLTVEQVPRRPLAMGRHDTVVSVRAARVLA